MTWREHTQLLALQAAEYYYDNVLLKGKYPGDFNRLPKDRNEAIFQLAKENVGKLREAMPTEADYNDDIARKFNALDVGATSKYMFEFGENPFTGTRKVELSKIIDNGNNERTWYNMAPKEIEAQMYRFGYDPAVKGDKQKFLDEVAAFQTSYDRGNVVQNTLDGKEDNSVFFDWLPSSPAWLQKLGFAMNPTVTGEAIKQSLTGNFDDSRVNRALATDAITQGLMAAAPSFKAVAGNPLTMGLVEAGLEGARQVANYNSGYSYDPMAPFAAGMAAGTVPAGAQYIGGILTRGASMEARPLARGFQRGLRGADDPYEAERNMLKEQLIAARKQGENVQNGLNPTGSPDGNLHSVSDLEQARAWDVAADKLRSMGFHQRELEADAHDAVMVARDKVAQIKREMHAVETDRTIRKKERDAQARSLQYELDAAQRELQDAAVNEANISVRDVPMVSSSPEYDAGTLYVEDVIGRDPSRMRGGSIQVTTTPKYSIDDVLKRSYDKPMEYLSLDAGSAATPDSYNANKLALELLRSQLPEKYAQEAVKNKAAYSTGLYGGRVLGGIFGRIEPVLKANPLQPTSYADKVNDFKKSEWYKNLPAEQKIALEKALKGDN